MTANTTPDRFAEALSRASEPYPDEIRIRASGIRVDGTVCEVRIEVGRDGGWWAGYGATAAAALDSAMADLRAGLGGAA